MNTNHEIPESVARLVAYHITLINEANEAVRHARITDKIHGGRGRYEWEYRTTNYPDFGATTAFFDEFERIAATKGINAEGVYAEHGGKPEPEPWSTDALSWVKTEG